MSELTQRQQEALAWLPTVGKATPSVCRAHGFSVRTLESLAARGLVHKSYGGASTTFPIFRPFGQR
jgi:hypothetical protein